METTRILPWLAALGLASCAGGGAPEEEPNPFGPTGIPPELRANRGPAGVPIVPGGTATVRGEILIPLDDSDILFTDPDNPDAGIPELAELMGTRRSGPWEDSETIARGRSVHEGKPMLIWFTRSGGRNSTPSANCRILTSELFAREEFASWADENVVRLRIDSTVNVPPETGMTEEMDMQLRIAEYVEEMKKRYRASGAPVLVMVAPSGDVTGRFRGYRSGNAQYLFGQLRHAEAVARKNHEDWRKDLESKGYRDWQGANGRNFFARLLAYRDGDMILVAPDGMRARTHESRVSHADRLWINEQKRQRGMP